MTQTPIQETQAHGVLLTDEAAVTIAKAGLASLHERMRWSPPDSSEPADQPLSATLTGSGEAVLETRSFCVAEWLPESVSLTGAAVRDHAIVVTLVADRAVFTDEALAQRGTCTPAP